MEYDFQSGQWVTLEILREADRIGYFLEGDILLHYAETTEKLEIGQKVRVFLFHDKKDRLAATTKSPCIEWGEIKALTIIEIHPRFGYFLDMGLSRQVLLPLAECPNEFSWAPQVGDAIYVQLTHDKQGRLLAKRAKQDDFAKLVFPAPESWFNLEMDARVHHVTEEGALAIVLGEPVGFGVFGFIHHSQMPNPLRVGQLVKARISYIREDGKANLSLWARKEVMREEGAEQILKFLQARPNGWMPYSDKTSPEIIKQVFGLSKAAFKRALGLLYKEGKVQLDPTFTQLVENDKIKK